MVPVTTNGESTITEGVANCHPVLNCSLKSARPEDFRFVADEVAQRFSENLARCLKQAGYSQERLAQLAELHRTQISELLRARQLPRLDSVIRLSGALGVEPAELLEGIRFEPAGSKGRYKIAPTTKR